MYYLYYNIYKMKKEDNIKTKRVAQGEYRITSGTRTFDVSYSVSLNEWKIYENGEWWETVRTLKAAKEYIKEITRGAA